MKLRNKKTGKIEKLVGYVKTGDDRMFFRFEDATGTYKKEYNSLTELNEEWEDYEEPKVFWYIYGDQVLKAKCDGVIENMNKPIGNYFETEEEAEKAIEKLKAWKRLKDRGLKITGYGEYVYDTKSTHHINIALDYVRDEDRKDLELLFGGENE